MLAIKWPCLFPGLVLATKGRTTGGHLCGHFHRLDEGLGTGRTRNQPWNAGGANEGRSEVVSKDEPLCMFPSRIDLPWYRSCAGRETARIVEEDGGGNHGNMSHNVHEHKVGTFGYVGNSKREREHSVHPDEWIVR